MNKEDRKRYEKLTRVKSVNMKYIILDELTLEIVNNQNGKKLIFEEEEKAVEWGINHGGRWRIISIPFNQ